MDNSIIKKLRITRVIEETANAKSFELEPLDGWQPGYNAGQFITLVFYTPHGEKRRSYSITSTPGIDERLSITVKKIENGEFSRALVYYSKVGDILFTSGISGFFTLNASAAVTQFCFLAAGSGITPCFSLIKALLATTNFSILLLYSNRTKADTIFYKQLLQLQEDNSDRFLIHFLFSDHHDLYHRRLGKWLLEQLLNKYLGDSISHTSFFLCGPFEYMQTAEITLLNHVAKKNIVKENFSSLPRLVLPVPPDTAKHEVTVRINGHIHHLQVQYPLSITKAAKQQRVDLPYSCEAGRCGSCIATCTRGKLWMAYNEVLTDKEVARGRILTCQAFPVDGNAEVTFDEN